MEGQFHKTKIVILLFILTLIIILTAGIIFFKPASPPPTLPQIITTKPPITSTLKKLTKKQWINCPTVKDIIEEEEKLFLACLGGVLIINKNTGQVLDQITMTQGLGNNITTSLVKKDDELFIGTQDGFTRFNLKTRQAKKISVKEGLTNGANIILAADDDNLWVGTFNGLNLYHLRTEAIKTYTHELIDNATTFDVKRILVTDKSVYVTILANAYSPGGIARFDKEEQKWEKFGPASFLEKIDQYSRVDFLDLVQVGNYIYVSDNKNIWQTENKKGGQWKKIESISQQLKKDSPNYFFSHIFSYNNLLYIITHETFSAYLYAFNPQDNILKKIYPNFPVGSNILQNSNSPYLLVGNKLYFNKNWLSWLNLDTLQPGALTLKQRPTEFKKLLAVVDNQLFFCADKKIWQYSPTENIFKQFVDIPCDSTSPDNPNFSFIPIANSNQIFHFYQECGMGCNKPMINLINYDDQSIKKIEIPEQILTPFNPLTNDDWASLSFKKHIEESNEIEFNFYSSDGIKKTIFNLNNFSWSQPEKIAESTNSLFQKSKIFCNPIYSYQLNGKKFNRLNCKNTLETHSSRFLWEEKEMDNKPTFKILEENKLTGEKKELFLPKGAPLPYSPFENFYSQKVNLLTTANESLIIATNTGLYFYYPKEKKWKILTIKEGLITNEVEDFITNGNIIWVINYWGGLVQLVL